MKKAGDEPSDADEPKCIAWVGAGRHRKLKNGSAASESRVGEKKALLVQCVFQRSSTESGTPEPCGRPRQPHLVVHERSREVLSGTTGVLLPCPKTARRHARQPLDHFA